MTSHGLRCVGAVLIMLLATLTGCTYGAPHGSSVITIYAANTDEEAAIRGQLWRVEHAIDQVVTAYDIEHLTINVFIKQLGGLGQISPDIKYTTRVLGGSVSLNKQLLIDPPDNIDDVLLGLFAHELAHAMHYEAMSTIDLADFGQRYLAFYNNPNGRYQRWARAYERLTDLTAIAHGFAQPLAAQKEASSHNMARFKPRKVWDFYLTGDEIASLAADPADLSQHIDDRLKEVNLPSLNRWAKRNLHPRLERPEAIAASSFK